MQKETPVVLLGTATSGKPVVVGLFESKGAAQRAVLSGDLPTGCYYSVFTPALNSYTAMRRRDAVDEYEGFTHTIEWFDEVAELKQS